MDEREEAQAPLYGVSEGLKQRRGRDGEKLSGATVASGSGLRAPGSTPQPKQVRFSVVFCGGEDPEFVAAELNAHSPQTKGWQSPAFCSFPVELGLGFSEGEAQLSQLQILSHENKIATKIDVFVGRGSKYEMSSFQRLGHLSLDSNERSNFAARELKSVYIGKQGNFLKLLVHKNHLNKHNIYNQVGIIAINVLGSPVQVQSSYLQGGITGSSNNNNHMGYAPVPGKHIPPLQDLALDMNFDPKTARLIREVHEAKEKAVEDEEYELAKELKQEENRLKQVGSSLAKLEASKREAVSQEDYDEAAAIKKQIEALRGELEAEIYPLLHRGRPVGRNARSRSHRPLEEPAMRQRTPSPPRDQHFFDGYGNNNGASPQRPSPNQAPARTPTIEDERPLPVLSKNSARSPMESSRSVEGEPPLRQHPETEAEIPKADPAVVEEALTGVPDAQDLPDAEALPEGLSAEIQPMTEIFHEYLIRCLYSRQVRLRTAALTKIEMDLARIDFGDRKVLPAFCAVARVSISDKIASIYVQGIKLLELCCTKADATGVIRKTDIHPQLDPLMPSLIEKLGHNAARLRDVSAQLLKTLSRLKCVGVHYLASFVLKLLRRGKSMLWRQLLGRLKILVDFISEFGMREENGLGLEAVMQLITANNGHMNPNAEVRECAKEVVLQAYSEVGDAVLPYLKDLRPKQREEYEAGFAEIDRGQGRSPSKRAPPKVSARSQGSPTPSKKKHRGSQSPMKRNNTRASFSTGSPKSQASRDINININLQSPSKLDRFGGMAEEVEDEEEYSDEEDPYKCQFCGRYDPEFTQDALDLHYWKECPMLTSCAQCEQVIEVSMLNDHLLNECEMKYNHQKCPRCWEAIASQFFEQHVKRGACVPAQPLNKASRCPICHKDVKAGEEGWREHILEGSGCPKNPRTLALR